MWLDVMLACPHDRSRTGIIPGRSVTWKRAWLTPPTGIWTPTVSTCWAGGRAGSSIRAAGQKPPPSAEEVLRLHPGSAVIALPGITTLGHLKARQGHPDASRWLDQARELALPTGEFQRIGPVAVARAEAAWWNGQPERVLQEIQPAETLIDPAKGGYLLGAIAYWTWQAGGGSSLGNGNSNSLPGNDGWGLAQRSRRMGADRLSIRTCAGSGRRRP